jgi:hypothetical protein
MSLLPSPTRTFSRYRRSFSRPSLDQDSSHKLPPEPISVHSRHQSANTPTSPTDTSYLASLTGMDDQFEWLDGPRRLEAGECSPNAPPSTSATRSIRPQHSEVQPEGHVDSRLVAIGGAYDALDEGFIRLVRIAQDPTTGDIECRTQHFPLEDPPPYTAVFYACGPGPANFHLKLNGRAWHIRKNLSCFLR